MLRTMSLHAPIPAFAITDMIASTISKTIASTISKTIASTVASTVASIAASTLASTIATADAATVVDFSVRRWTISAGGDGGLRALVVIDGPSWSWHDASALATAVGATLARADSQSELSFLEALCDHPGAFDCAGPWLDGFRQPQSTWTWTTNAMPVPNFGWPPLRPAQSMVFPSALLMSGIDGPDGRWIDVFPDPDAGVATRSALLRWTNFEDCDGDDLPDLLEIARTPTLDADHNGQLDDCTHPNPADINGDGLVNASDLSLLLNAWGTADAKADIDRNGTVNALDLTVILSAWTET